MIPATTLDGCAINLGIIVYTPAFALTQNELGLFFCLVTILSLYLIIVSL